MISLYCVVDDPAAARAACRGSGPEGVMVIGAGRLGCVGRMEVTPLPSDDPQALVDHDAVIRRLMGTCTVLPFRYGTAFSSEGEVQAQMDARAGEFELLLRKLRGKVELALRASAAPPPRRCASSGRGYLRALRHEAGGSVLHELHKALAASSDSAVVTADRPCSIKSSYLVDESGIERFCRLLAQTLSGLEGVRDTSLTGPWAPYSFVTEATDIPVSAPASQGVGDA